MGLTKHTWKTLAPYFEEKYPELANVINEISPPDDHSLYVAEYPYGALILDKGIFQVINEKKCLVPLNDESISNNIKEDLTYTGTMPMGMVRKNSIETFFFSKKRNKPSASTLFTEKGFIALWCALEENQTYQAGPIWNVSSGARTVCMLPKITDKTGYKRLNLKYQLKITPPLSSYDHWEIFNKLASHRAFPEAWNSEVIFFSKKWFQHKNDKQWARLYQFFAELVWKASIFRRNQYLFDFAFSTLQENKNLKPNPYLADTFKHIIAISAGEAVGLAPAINNIAAPISGLQQVFIEEYGLKKYAPVIMHSHHFMPDKERPVYYSFEMPITTIFSPRSSQASSKMVDIRDLKDIVNIFITETLKGNLMIEKTPLFNLAKNIQYDFYHSDQDPYNEVSDTTGLKNLDPNFNKILYQSKELSFPEFSPFFKGCVSIKRK